VSASALFRRGLTLLDNPPDVPISFFNQLILFMKQLLTTLLLVVVTMASAWAQRTIMGVVSGDDGEVLIGATVSIKGTSRGARTDVNGKYSVEVPNGATTLVVSYTGYATQEVAIGSSNAIDVVLQAGTNLTEVVVTATGITRNKSDLVYSDSLGPQGLKVS